MFPVRAALRPPSSALPRRLRRFATALAVATGVVVLGAAGSAWAGHGRGTSLSVTVAADGSATVVLDQRTAHSCIPGEPMGHGGTVELLSLDGPGGGRTPIRSYSGDDICRRTAGNLSETRTTIAIPAQDLVDGWYVVRHQSGAKVSGIVNVNGGASSTNWSSEAQFRKVAASATGSPAFGVDLPFAASIGFAYNQNLSATDPDGGPVTARTLCCNAADPDFAVSTDVIQTSPANTGGAEIVGQQLVIPAETTVSLTAGQYLEFKVRVTDDDGEYSDLDMVLSPTDNVPPSFDTEPALDHTVRAGGSTTIPLSARDPDGTQSVVFSLSGQPSWITLTQTSGNPVTGTITVAPPAGVSGAFTINLNASDDDGSLPATASRTLVITVPAAPATRPEAGATTPVVIRNGAPVTVPVYAGPVAGAAPLVSIAGTPSAQGSWSTTAKGEVYTAGDAQFFGSLGGTGLNSPITAITPTVTGDGYWLAGADGGVFAFGDAAFHGSMGAVELNQPVRGIVSSCSGEGYYLVALDGGVFAFGDARYVGSMGGSPLNKAMVGIVPDCDDSGYWTFASDGGVFAFGASFHGSLGAEPPAAGVAAMAAADDGRGYWLITGANTAHAFGSAAR